MYEFWLWFAIENSIVVVVFALIAELLSRRLNNARIANLLWMVLLAKFMIPSFLLCEVPLLPARESLETPAVVLDSDQAEWNAGTTDQSTRYPIEPTKIPSAVVPGAFDSAPTTKNVEIAGTVSSESSARTFTSLSWPSFVCLVWMIGSFVWFSVFAIRLRRFQTGLQTSYQADESLQTLARKIGRHFRLVRVPEIRVVEATISPMLWSYGWRPQILLPANILLSTSNDGMTAVLAHEMAHLRRYDHWSQRYAMLILGIFWWHPVSWIAVRRLRQTQDACCDMDVVEWSPNLRVAFAQSLVDVAAKMSMKAPPLALSFLDRYSLHARIQSILDGNNHARPGLFRSCLLLLIGFTLSSVSARVVAQTAQQTPAKQQPVDAPKEQVSTPGPEENAKRTDKALFESRSEIEVFNPDGSVASNVSYLVGKRHLRLTLDDSLEAVAILGFGNPGTTTHVDNGKIPLEFDPTDEFIAAWNENGFFQIAISRLDLEESIKLQRWVTLQVELRTKDGPDIGANISVSNRHTSDGRYSAMSFIYDNVVSDRNGKAVLTRVPPGTVTTDTHVESVRRGDSIWSEYKRSRGVQAAPGATIQLSFGGTGRQVRGSLSFPINSIDGDFADLTGEIECLQTKERVTIQVAVDGSFDCEEVPFGPCKISIRSRSNFDQFRARRVYLGTKNFECNANSSETLSIGNISLERSPPLRTQALDLEKTVVQDGFISNKKVTVVATEKREKPHYILLDNEGQLIRSLDSIEVPNGWAFNYQFVAFDTKRDRLYLLSAHEPTTKSQKLYTLDFSGKILTSRSLEPLWENHIALDSSTGNLWVLSIEKIGNSRVSMFAPEGDPLKNFSIDAFALCYSAVDKAFWVGGSSFVAKVDPVTGESMASYNLPEGVFTISSVIPAPEGGVLAIECKHPENPRSANRVWLFDSKANRSRSADVGDKKIHSAIYFDGEYWCSGKTIEGPSNGVRKISSVFLGFNRKLEPLPDRTFEFTSLGGDAQAKTVWAIQGNKLQRVSKDRDGRLEIVPVGSIPLEGRIWTNEN